MRVARLAGVYGPDLAIGVDDHVVSLEACGEIGVRLATQGRTALDVVSLPPRSGASSRKRPEPSSRTPAVLMSSAGPNEAVEWTISTSQLR